MQFKDILGQLSLEEKVTLLSGRDFVSTPGITEKNIPPLKTVDSINGIRPNDFHGELTTASFPNTTCLASTWNTELLELMGREVARQAKTKHAQIVMGPTINIHRDPRAGRNFECFSEDPLLSGYLGAAIVNGIQSQGLGACVKHFVCNDSETMRRYYNVAESPHGRTLREIYLAAWQNLLKTSNPVAIMTAYNKVDGKFCSDSRVLIEDIVRKEWGYDGTVMSDWFGTRSTVSAIKAGLDLEMPMPVFRGPKLLEAVRNGEVTEQEIDSRVSKVLELRDRTRSSHGEGPEKSEIMRETNEAARNLALEGIVLLKNDQDALPLQISGSLKIAVIGEYAQRPVFTGGGSASCKPQYRQIPLDILQKAHPVPEHVKYVPGVRTRVIVPVAPIDKLTTKSGQQGVEVSYFNGDSDKPFLTEAQNAATVFMLGNYKPNLELAGSHIEMSTCLIPATTGIHLLGVRHSGVFSLQVNNSEVLSGDAPNITTEQFLFRPLRYESRVELSMEAGKPYHIQIAMQARKPSIGEPTPYGLTLCFEEFYSEADAIVEAASAAAEADVSIIYAGRSDQHESEGFDLGEITLPSNQTALIKAVAAVSKKTVLLLHCGNPVDVSSFVDDVDAIANMHFPGQEGPKAMIDILTGKVNPSGRLPSTWFKTLQDWPSYPYFPAKPAADGSHEIRYEEGLEVGYRAAVLPDRIQWPFGHGLSYTSFSYQSLRVSTNPTSPASLQIAVSVTNTGSVPGKEVVQVYICPPDAPVWRPQRELKWFTKLLIEPGQTREVVAELTIFDACSRWNETEKTWVIDRGTHGIEVKDCRANFSI
ncbi:putative glycosyl hydrolase [Aspergillus californicus]